MQNAPAAPANLRYKNRMRMRKRWLGAGMSLYLLGCASGATKQSVSLYESGDYRGARAAAERGLATAPDDEDASRMHVRAQLALGDGAEVARSYHRHKLARAGNDDAALVLELAEATLGQGLRSPSTALRLASIRAVEESELRGLADAVAERMTDPDDRVVATAAAAVLRGYPDAVEALDDMLRSEDEEARRIALDGLGRKVAKHARAELTAGAADPDPSVRRTALRHLASLRDPSSATRPGRARPPAPPPPPRRRARAPRRAPR